MNALELAQAAKLLQRWAVQANDAGLEDLSEALYTAYEEVIDAMEEETD